MGVVIGLITLGWALAFGFGEPVKDSGGKPTFINGATIRTQGEPFLRSPKEYDQSAQAGPVWLPMNH